MSALYVDIGNSRLKWQCGEQGGRIETLDGDNPLAAWATLSPSAVVLAQVGSDRWRQHCGQWAEHRAVPLIEATTTRQAAGLRCAYQTPANLGIDRWLAMIAAFHRCGACYVADIGTALTLDAVDDQGQHLGGLISTGPKLARDSVVAQAPRVFGEDPVRADGWLATDTPQAIRSGAVLACASLIDRFVETNNAQQNNDWPLLVCGGAADIISPWLRSKFEPVPDLVLEGLAIWHQHRRQ
ncbi:MAG: type III pantothenate kinase [Lysobacteraceae bacterium]|nr:MAG: type III pantothenate kinase [Xanthomonadaceae bacterium]